MEGKLFIDGVEVGKAQSVTIVPTLEESFPKRMDSFSLRGTLKVSHIDKGFWNSFAKCELNSPRLLRMFKKVTIFYTVGVAYNDLLKYRKRG